MNRYIDRCVDRLIERDLVIFGAVLVQGPKWCGKTTTAHRFAESSLSLSDPAGGFAALQLARLDPAQAITGAAPRLIDEWQEEPKLWDAVRFECDARGGEPGQFILTGSATPNDADRPMHSGVGQEPVQGKRRRGARARLLGLGDRAPGGGDPRLTPSDNKPPVGRARASTHRRRAFTSPFWAAQGPRP